MAWIAQKDQDVRTSLECVHNGCSFKLPGVGTPKTGGLSSFDKFFVAYGNVEGKKIAFSYDEKEKVWTRNHKMSPSIETVDEFVSEWEKIVKQVKETEKYPQTVYYLTDIPIRLEDLRIWQESHPLIDFCSASGLGDFHNYVALYRPGTVLPLLCAHGYLSPPVGIGSGPHFDGAGACISVHSFLFGSGYQQITLYPKMSPEMQTKVLDIIGRPSPFFLPQDPLPPSNSKRPAHLLQIDDSPTAFNDTLCKNVAKCEGGPNHVLWDLMEGSTVWLSNENMHAFKKCHTTGPQPDVSEFGRFEKKDLLLSVAGKCRFFLFPPAFFSLAA